MSTLKSLQALILASPLLFCACQTPAQTIAPVHYNAKSSVSEYGHLKVQERHIVANDGRVVSLAGPSFFWSNTGYGQSRFYTSGAVDTFAKDWNAGIVRAAIGGQGEGSYLEDPDANYDRATIIVDAAIENGIYVIVDWHSHHAEKNFEEAASFFRKIATRYGETPNIIYEIYNEPLNTADWARIVKPYSQRMIKVIRDIDPDNLIVVGTPSWAQDVDVAADDPILGEDNILYSLHFYASSHKAEKREKAQYAIDRGLPLMITEWGTVSYSGDGKMDKQSSLEWMTFAKKNGLSHMTWAVSDKKETASMFKPGAASEGSWTQKDLTPSGKFIRRIIQNWNE